MHVVLLAGGLGSRLAEDLVLWSTREFAFARLPDAFTTGSSAMPQKRNPDAMELARAKAGRALGRYAALGATLKALPSGYNKDLQEDKEGVFDAFDTARAIAHALTGTVSGLVLDSERTRAVLGGEILAAEVAERLAATGIPFRDAYKEVARAVAAGEDLSSLAPGLSLESALDRRAAHGGTAPARVREALASVEQWLSSEEVV